MKLSGEDRNEITILLEDIVHESNEIILKTSGLCEHVRVEIPGLDNLGRLHLKVRKIIEILEDLE